MYSKLSVTRYLVAGAFALFTAAAHAMPILALDFRDASVFEATTQLRNDARVNDYNGAHVGVGAIGWYFQIANGAEHGLGVLSQGSDNALVDGREHVVIRLGDTPDVNGLLLGALFAAGDEAAPEQARVRAWDRDRNVVLDRIVSGTADGSRIVAFDAAALAISHIVVNAVGNGDFGVVGVTQVSEPATPALFLLGMMGMMGMRQRMQRTRAQK